MSIFSPAVLQIATLIKARVPMIWVTTFEEDKFCSELEIYFNTKGNITRELWSWSSYQGLTRFKNRNNPSRTTDADEKTVNAQIALETIMKTNCAGKEGGQVFVMKDFHTVLSQPLPRQLRDYYHSLIRERKTLIFVAPVISHGPSGSKAGMEPTLEKQISVVEYSLPSYQDLLDLVESFLEPAQQKVQATGTDVPEKLLPTDGQKQEVVRALQGLTLLEAETALVTCLVEKKGLEPLFLLEQKKQVIRRSDILEYIETPFGLEHIGGLDELKKYLSVYKSQFEQAAKDFGVEPLKGVLLVGMPGGGKSLTAKALGCLWKLPLLRLDVGKVFQGIVGASEERIRSVISQAEAVAPCVTGDTLISLADGSQVPIRELWASNRDHLEVACWDEKALKVATTQVKAITRREWKTIKLKAAHGFEITCTPEHLHYVMRGKEPEWVKTADLKVGDCLAIPTSLPNINLSIEEILPPDLYTETNDARIFWGQDRSRRASIPKIPQSMSTNLAYLAGLIISDGYISNNTIGFVNTEEILHDKFGQILMEEFGLQTSRNITKGEDIKQYLIDHPNNYIQPTEDSIFRDVWRSNKGSKIAAYIINNIINNTDRLSIEQKKALLAGWIDGDGYISNENNDAKIVFCIKDKKTIWEYTRKVRQLLISIGIIPSQYNGSNGIEITGSRAEKLAKLLRPYLILKPHNKVLPKSSDNGFDRNIGWCCGELITQERINSATKHKDIDISTNTFWRHTHNFLINERHMELYAKTFSSVKIQQLIDAECRWIQIQQIESSGEQEVFDLVCIGDNTRSFIGNLMITHNCVLWVDEIEKSLSGVKSSNSSDGGTMARVFGTLLTAMEERMKNITVIATANDISSLPPELIRRFNEVFFIDLPVASEREEIFKIHLSKRKRNLTNFEIDRLASTTEGFTGAEIEKVVKEGIMRAYQSEMPDVSTELLLEAIQETRPLSQVMDTEIKRIREWAENRARFASSLSKPKKYKKASRKARIDDILDEENEAK